MQMTRSNLENLIRTLDVNLNAFAVCELEAGFALKCAPSELVVVHFVLRGEGSIQWDGGKVDLAPGTIAIIPAHLTKVINGQGPIHVVADAEKNCRLSHGIAKFKAGANQGDLVLGCGALEVDSESANGPFANLTEPVFIRSRDSMLPLLFGAILAELSSPGIGSKSIVEAAMAQVLVVMLRSHFEEAGGSSPFALSADCSVGLRRALDVILKCPENAYSLDQLASVAGMSRARFAHHFAARFGESPLRYVRTVRLKKAARLLQETSVPVKAVAAAVGFSSRSQFSSAFRRAFGADPTSFRQRSRLDPTL
ncbi:MAG: AraC family transcriptional regulator [Croceibacterium sp.]